MSKSPSAQYRGRKFFSSIFSPSNKRNIRSIQVVSHFRSGHQKCPFWEWEKATFTSFPHFRKSPSLPLLSQLHSFVLVEWWGQWCVISGDQRIGACDYRPDQTSAIGAQPHIGEKEVPYISSHVNLTSRTSQIGSRNINICLSHRNANLVQILFFWNWTQPAL